MLNHQWLNPTYDFDEHIIYNPAKHGLVKAPKDWPYSSFHKYMRERKYDLNWGAGQLMTFDEAIGKE